MDQPDYDNNCGFLDYAPRQKIDYLYLVSLVLCTITGVIALYSAIVWAFWAWIFEHNIMRDANGRILDWSQGRLPFICIFGIAVALFTILRRGCSVIFLMILCVNVAAFALYLVFSPR